MWICCRHRGAKRERTDNRAAALELHKLRMVYFIGKPQHNGRTPGPTVIGNQEPLKTPEPDPPPEGTTNNKIVF